MAATFTSSPSTPAPASTETSASYAPAPPTADEDSALIASLHTLSASHPKLVKSSIYPAPADPSIEVRSWKMNEFKYYEIPSPFPTLARGLFTREVEVPGGDGAVGTTAQVGEKEKKKGKGKRYEIVVRGYDKFFNIGEVPWTTWESIETHTKPPYTLSLKSNGCIIFIAALTPSKLIVTSKHSLGPVKGQDTSHAEAGERWLRVYLEQKGKREADLAGVLWERNWTAIAELCDDSFEEHVLGYPPEKTGLHLHGLNTRTKSFTTMPPAVVDAFADTWGFIKTPHIILDTISEVREFTTQCAERGEWNGEAVEGFVVRTSVSEPPGPTRKGKNAEEAVKEGGARSPYEEGSSFFFKVKFDEPYMMYRDWREITKTLLSKGASPATVAALPKNKMKRKETQLYVKWVMREIGRDPKAFEMYTRGKGIVGTRERYLKWVEGGGEREFEGVGKDGVEEQGKGAEEKEGQEEWGKTVIVPVAIPGCGKTAVSVALAHLFGFGHTQSDDVHAKKAAPIFIKNVLDLLKTKDVVIADKNNHLKIHRQSLRDAVSSSPKPVRLVALDWSSSIKSLPPARVHNVCTDRVERRGENHQTLRADLSERRGHEGVVWMFLGTLEELSYQAQTPTSGQGEVDACIEMQLGETLEEAVKRAVDGLVTILGLERPSEEKIQEALKVVEGYVPMTRKEEDGYAKVKGKNNVAKEGAKETAVVTDGVEVKAKLPRFYGILPELDFVPLLDGILSSSQVDLKMKAFWDALKSQKKYAMRPHVTLVHSKAINEEKELWERCRELALVVGDKDKVEFEMRLGGVLWDGRIMAVRIDEFGIANSSAATAAERQQGQEFVSKLNHEVRERLHITVGMLDAKVQAVEAKGMVEMWRKGERQGIVDVPIVGDGRGAVVVKGRVKGLNG